MHSVITSRYKDHGGIVKTFQTVAFIYPKTIFFALVREEVERKFCACQANDFSKVVVWLMKA